MTKFPPYFSFTVYCFYKKISSFMPVLPISIVLDCFYLLIFHSEKFSTDVCCLPFAVNVNLNLSVCLHSRSFLLLADWWESNSSVDMEPRGNWRWNSNSRAGGEAKLYRYVPPHRVGFCSENRYKPYPFRSGIGYRFWGNYGSVWKYSSRFNSKWVRKKDKYANSKWLWRILFFLCSNLRNDNVISA